MKRLIFASSLLLLLCSPGVYAAPSPQNAETYKPVAGLEWMEMSVGERVDNLMASMYLLNKNGIELSYTTDHYYDVVYQKLQRNPGLYTSDLTDILANCVYEKEPASRPVLDQLRKKHA